MEIVNAQPTKEEPFQSIIYLVTELGTIIGLSYDFRNEKVFKVRITSYLKRLFDSKIKEIQVTQGN